MAKRISLAQPNRSLGCLLRFWIRERRAIIVSKLALLGWWTYYESIFDIELEEYSTDWSYENARTVRTA